MCHLWQSFSFAWHQFWHWWQLGLCGGRECVPASYPKQMQMLEMVFNAFLLLTFLSLSF
jgi:hypothetical protein